MKRFFALFLCALFLAGLFTSCAEKITDPTGEKVEVDKDMLGPLFRLRAPEGMTAPETEYYPTEKGVAYVTKGEKGYLGGYFQLPDLVSNEKIFSSAEKPSPVFDLGEEKAAVFADGKLILMQLDRGTSNSYDLHGKMAYTDILLGADGAFYYENEKFLLTADWDFSENGEEVTVTERVVMPKDKIPGYTGMLAVSEDGERLYYSYEENGERGYAYFGIGYRAEALGKTPVEYVSYKRISGTERVLFSSPVTDGKKTYTIVDFALSSAKTVTVAAGEDYTAVTADRDGNYLAGYLADADGKGGYLDLCTFETGKRLKHYELAELAINPSLALTTAGVYAIVGQFDTGAGFDDEGGETVTAIEIEY